MGWLRGWLLGADFDDAGVEEVDGLSDQRVLGEGWVDRLGLLLWLERCVGWLGARGEFG